MSKKIKIKVKKRKINFKRVLLFLLILYLVIYGVLEIVNYKIKNIYIIGNNILSDYEIIDIAGIKNYPSFLKTSGSSIVKKVSKNDYIKEVEVKKKFFGKIYIYIHEKNIICNYNGKLLTEDGKFVNNNYNILDVPVLLSYIEGELFSNFYTSFNKVNNDIRLKISQIEYAPTNVDDERFLLYMNDGNYVYITLDKIDKLNKYNEIYKELDGKKGILNLDSGNSFEIRG